MSADKEDCVYQAKLAEQAERYDGKTPFSLCTKMFEPGRQGGAGGGTRQRRSDLAAIFEIRIGTS